MSRAKVFQVHPEHPNPRSIGAAVEVLKTGGVILYPTDTVYGLGCDIHRTDAVERIAAIKRRDSNKPFSFFCRDLAQVSEYASISNVAFRILRESLPGPYTFLLPATRKTPRVLQTKRRVAGIRVPDHAVTMALVEGFGSPILTTSANMSQEEPPSDVEDLKDIFGHQVDLILDAGPVGGRPSSVISLVDDTVEIIREGEGDLSLFR